MEQHVRLVVFEHLGNQFDIHILDIDLLVDVNRHIQHTSLAKQTCKPLFITMTASFNFSCIQVSFT
jgi:hypothetical protein